MTNPAKPTALPKASADFPHTPPIRGRLWAVAMTASLLVASLVVAVLAPNSTTALGIVALVSVIGHLALLAIAARRLGRGAEIGWMIFVFGVLFWFLYPATQQMLGGGRLYKHAVAISAYHRHFVSAVVGALVLSAMFQVGYLISFGARVRRRVRRLFGTNEFAPRKQLRLAAVLTSLNVLGFMVMTGGPGGYIGVLLAGRTSNPIWQNVGNAGTAFTPINVFLTALGVVAGVFAGYLAVSGRVRGWRRLIGLGAWLVPITWAAFASGTRSVLLLAIGPPLLLYARERMRERGGFKTSTIVLILGTLIVLTVASNVIREFRAHATFEGDLDIELKDNDLFTNTALAAAIAEKENRLLYDSAVLQIVSLPIPRVLWKSKPRSETVPLFTRYVWGPAAYLRGKSNLPSIIGQYLLGWGWIGVFICGLTLGILVRFADDLIRHVPQFQVRLISFIFLIYVFTSFRVIGNSGASILYMAGFYILLARLHLSQPTPVTASVRKVQEMNR